jgi:hypothetical protein
MIILTILGIILFIAGVVFACYKINDYAGSRYGYEPFNFLTMALAIVPYILLFLSLFLGGKNQPLMERENFLAALAIFVIANIILLILLLRRTSIPITILSIPLAHIAGVLLICLFILSAFGDSDRRDRHRY